MNIGILALQGGYQAHAEYLVKRLNTAYSYVRNPTELARTDGLIISGGESSVFIKLLKGSGLWNNLVHYDKPIFGTCAGAILLAKQVLSPPQPSLNRIHITLERNAYGRQTNSQIALGTCLLTRRKLEMVFIRAPKITAIENKSVKILACYDNQPVAVQENNIMVTTFHPELSQDTYFHRHFIKQVKSSLNKKHA